MSRTLSAGDEFPLPCARYGVAISWDHAASTIDVDLQAVIFDNQGQLVDAVYFNNLKALKCITHSGDEMTGEKTGFDETVWVGLGKMPENIKLIIFVVAAFKGGHLRDALNGKIHILEESSDKQVASFSMEKSEQEVDAVAMMVRGDTNGGGWSLRLVNEDAQDGQHFIDILEPTLGGIVRSVIPGAPKRIKAAFAMQKGAVVDLPRASALQQIKAGLGWDTSKGKVDLDVSAVIFDRDGQAREAVFFGNLSAAGVKHSGDNLTGDGGGDDETISVDFQSVPDWVQQIFFCVNIYTKGVSFERVANPYCRILDGTNELARYELKEAGRESGLIIARLFRDTLRWGFQAVGTFCHGQTWKDSVPEIGTLFKKTPRELQLRGSSAGSLASDQPPAHSAHGGGGHHTGPPVSSPPIENAGPCCSLQ